MTELSEVIELGPDVRDLEVGDVLYASADHVAYTVMPEDGLLIVVVGGGGHDRSFGSRSTRVTETTVSPKSRTRSSRPWRAD